MSLFQKNLSRFKLITFDATDTLIKISCGPGIHYQRVAKQFGYDIREDRLNRHFRENYKILTREYPNFGQCSAGMKSWRDWWKTLVMRTFKDSGVNLSSNQLSAISNKLITEFETADCWIKIPFTDQLIKEMIKSNKKVGVITNSDPRTGSILKNLEFPPFEFVLTAVEVGVEKPKNEIFNLALQAGKITNPKEALHIGNDFERDYMGARNAGWNSILIGDYPRTIDDHPDQTFSTVEAFYKNLKERILEI